MSKVRIIGAVASPTGITLYLEDGKELNFLKDSIRAKAILEETVEALARKEIVEIDLDSYSVEKRIEKKTGGLISFFKTSVSRLLGSAPKTEHETILIGVMGKALQEAGVMKHDEEVSAAVVNLPTGPVVVPGIEALERQMEHAAYESVVGFENFMKRIASVLNERGHTVQELLNFMRRGDLPIADDGSIVAYKVLKTYGQGADHFVDCHSGNVKQRLGSHVSMPVDRVDDSKRTECSTGLHIARRGYLSGFGGDIITLVKVSPEDVVAVPNGEPDKMRAAGYHIVAVLPSRVHATLRAGKPMTGDGEASQILADVIAGKHVGILERVEIFGPKGSDVRITPVGGVSAEPIESTGKFVRALDDEDKIVSVSEIRKRADAAIQEQRAEASTSELSKAMSEALVTTAAPADVVNKAIGASKKAAPSTASHDQSALIDTKKPKSKSKAKPKKPKSKKVSKTVGDESPTTKMPVPAFIKGGGKSEANAEITRDSDYTTKLAEAQRLKNGGWSLREIEKHLGMCRKSLGKKLT
jgi:hypothetical protein